MFQESEIISLVVALVGAFLLVFVFARRSVPQLRRFYAAFFAIVAASFFTVVEGVFWEGLFNLLEHLCYMLSGIFFMLGCWSASEDFESREEGDR
jgi:Na+(H+)/acetate symporter ActP